MATIFEIVVVQLLHSDFPTIIFLTFFLVSVCVCIFIRVEARKLNQH